MISETIEARARRLVENEVVTCFSSIIHTMAKGYHDCEGLRGDLELVTLCEEASELCNPLQDWEEAAIQAGWSEHKLSHMDGTYWRRPCQGDEETNDPEETETEGNPVMTADSAQEACEHDDCEAYEREIFEHWQVTEWFGEKLKEAGERVGTFADKTIWGRTTTGQAIYADHVAEVIAKALMA